MIQSSLHTIGYNLILNKNIYKKLLLFTNNISLLHSSTDNFVILVLIQITINIIKIKVTKICYWIL